MNCEDCKEALDSYLDGIITLDEKNKIEAHLASCEVCKKEYQEMKQLVATLQNMPEVKLPKSFHQELMIKIKEEKVVPFKKKQHFVQYLTGMVACLVIGFIFVNQTPNNKLFVSKESTSEAPAAESMPTMQNATSDEETSEIAEGIMTEKSLGTSTTEEMDAYEESAEWQVEVSDESEFLGELEEYLIKKQIRYELQEQSVALEAFDEQAELRKWLLYSRQVVKLNVVKEGEQSIILSWYTK